MRHILPALLCLIVWPGMGSGGPKPVEIIAHRGASYDAPENTLTSQKLAWKQGADASEFDVFLSKDGHIVVIHDKNPKRLAGVEGNVAEMTLEELRKLDVGKWKGAAFAGERIPTLREALQHVPAKKRVFIEIKCGPEIVPELKKVLAEAKLPKEQTAIISFSAEVIAAVKKELPALQAYWIVGLGNGKEPRLTPEALIETAKKIQADGLDLSAHPSLDAAYVKKLNDAKLPVYVWTVNSVEVARKLIDAGVIGITTDRPGWLREQLYGSADPVPPVKIMSFNIRYGTAKDGENHWDKRKDFLVETIKRFDPDLLGTQETLGFQRDFLQKQLPGWEAWGVGRDDGKEAGEMTALFFRKERFTKLDGGHFWLSEKPNEPGSKSWDTSLTRIASWVKLQDRKLPNRPPIFFLNTHFDHRGNQARIESAKLIREQIGKLGKDCSVIITGDFNAGEGSGPYAALFGGTVESPVVDTFRVAVPKAGPSEGTFNSFKPGANNGPRIDWIGASRDWKVLRAAIDYTERDGRTPSDHFPVIAVLRR